MRAPLLRAGFFVLVAVVLIGTAGGFLWRHARADDGAATRVTEARTTVDHTPSRSARVSAGDVPCRVIEKDSLPGGVEESSGVARSRHSPGLLWTHNDSGDPALFAVDEHGVERGRVRVSGATLEDWEDIASGPCPEGNCLYIADIGDNDAKRPSITLYRVPEPEPSAKATAPAEVFHATYPDGAQDAEALIVLPDGAIYLVSKGETGPAGLYRFPQFLHRGKSVVLEKVAALSEESLRKSERITGASASPDGRWVALRTLHSLALYPAGEAVEGRFTEPAVEMDLSDLQEPQGEGVALANGGSVFLTSEAGGKKEPAVLSHLACALPE